MRLNTGVSWLLSEPDFQMIFKNWKDVANVVIRIAEDTTLMKEPKELKANTFEVCVTNPGFLGGVISSSQASRGFQWSSGYKWRSSLCHRSFSNC